MCLCVCVCVLAGGAMPRVPGPPPSWDPRIRGATGVLQPRHYARPADQSVLRPTGREPAGTTAVQTGYYTQQRMSSAGGFNAECFMQYCWYNGWSRWESKPYFCPSYCRAFPIKPLKRHMHVHVAGRPSGRQLSRHTLVANKINLGRCVFCVFFTRAHTYAHTPQACVCANTHVQYIHTLNSHIQ